VRRLGGGAAAAGGGAARIPWPVLRLPGDDAGLEIGW